MFASGQVVSQKLLASDEASLLQVEFNSYDDACEYLGCNLSFKGNGVCDKKCNIWQCYYDGGDCDKYVECYSRGCNSEDLGNGRCDTKCNHYTCDFDKDDCKFME
jgi:hypothetical protein